MKVLWRKCNIHCHALIVYGVFFSEKYRGNIRHCYNSVCDESEYLTYEKIYFVAKTIKTVVLTLELMADGRMKHFIQASIKKNSDSITSSSNAIQVKGKLLIGRILFKNYFCDHIKFLGILIIKKWHSVNGISRGSVAHAKFNEFALLLETS